MNLTVHQLKMFVFSNLFQNVIVKHFTGVTKYSNPITWGYFTCEEIFKKLVHNHTQ